MRFQVPISTLFTQVFGIAAPLIRKYEVKPDNSKPANAKYQVFMEEQEEEDLVMSNMGTPVHFSMGFEGGHYNVMNKGVIERVFLGGMALPYTSVASFTRAKRMTETFMSGYKGSVIEQYGFEPWSIRIQGFIIKEADPFLRSVAKQVEELQQYEEVCDALEVNGKGFEIRKIKRASIIDIKYPEARDLNINIIQPFEMTLKSIEPIELIIP